jgi:hypothetical protein
MQKAYQWKGRPAFVKKRTKDEGLLDYYFFEHSLVFCVTRLSSRPRNTIHDFWSLHKFKKKTFKFLTYVFFKLVIPIHLNCQINTASFLTFIINNVKTIHALFYYLVCTITSKKVGHQTSVSFEKIDVDQALLSFCLWLLS